MPVRLPYRGVAFSTSAEFFFTVSAVLSTRWSAIDLHSSPPSGNALSFGHCGCFGFEGPDIILAVSGIACNRCCVGRIGCLGIWSVAGPIDF